jgi:hypothetical protein
MERERGIIIIGHCRAGKDAMIRQAIKERCVLIGADFGDMASDVLALNMSFEYAAVASKKLNDAMMELKSISPDRRPSMRDDFLSNVKNGSIKFRSFQEDLNTIVYEKIQSKFISRPRNNFRKR